MTHNRGDQQSFADVDDFFTALSKGQDPSRGDDELAGLLLGLRADAHSQPLPKTPELDAYLGVSDEAEAIAAEDAGVVSLEERRRLHRPSPKAWMSGLVGAAAASAFILGGGAMLYNASPESPLYGLSSQVFRQRTTDNGDQATLVELAGTLDEMNNRAQAGDMAGARLLIDQARDLLVAHQGEAGPAGAPQKADGQKGDGQKAQGRTETTTVTVPALAPEADKPGEEQPAPAATVTETVTETQTVTATPSETAGQVGTSEKISQPSKEPEELAAPERERGEAEN